jgi:hypothetical protein
LDRQIKRTGPSLILTEAMLRRPRRRAGTSNDHQQYLEDKKHGLTRMRQKLRSSIHAHAGVFAVVGLLAKISPA